MQNKPNKSKKGFDDNPNSSLECLFPVQKVGRSSSVVHVALQAARLRTSLVHSDFVRHIQRSSLEYFQFQLQTATVQLQLRNCVFWARHVDVVQCFCSSAYSMNFGGRGTEIYLLSKMGWPAPVAV